MPERSSVGSWVSSSDDTHASLSGPNDAHAARRPAVPMRPVKLPGGYRTVSGPHGLDDELLNLPRC